MRDRKQIEGETRGNNNSNAASSSFWSGTHFFFVQHIVPFVKTETLFRFGRSKSKRIEGRFGGCEKMEEEES